MSENEEFAREAMNKAFQWVCEDPEYKDYTINVNPSEGVVDLISPDGTIFAVTDLAGHWTLINVDDL